MIVKDVCAAFPQLAEPPYHQSSRYIVRDWDDIDFWLLALLGFSFAGLMNSVF